MHQGIYVPSKSGASAEVRLPDSRSVLSRSYPLWSRVADISDTVPVAIRLIKVGHQRAVIPDVWNTITIGVRELVHVNQPGGFDSIYIAVSPRRRGRVYWRPPRPARNDRSSVSGGCKSNPKFGSEPPTPATSDK